ncbi:MAG: peptide-methionine (S)-S-oxide reductase MsrA, partial [Pseudomonadota bacterium]
MIKLSTGTALAAALSVSLFTSTGAAGQTRTAIFAGGCFWCVEADFDKVDGVLSTVSGYTGGNTTNPTYKSVTYGNSGHYEAVRVTYNSAIVSYETLTEYFLRHVDPTDDGGQFCDRGHSYKTAIFVATPQERDTAETEIEEAAE